VNTDILASLLETRQWRRANEETRVLLCNSETEWPERLPIINRLWQHNSNDRFGFETQGDIYAGLGCFSHSPGPETWALFDIFGTRVGWRLAEDRMWYSWEDRNPEPSIFPSLCVSAEFRNIPRGCLPFHDVLIDETSSGFLARDCWGEYNWDRWAKLFRLVKLFESEKPD